MKLLDKDSTFGFIKCQQTHVCEYAWTLALDPFMKKHVLLSRLLDALYCRERGLHSEVSRFVGILRTILRVTKNPSAVFMSRENLEV